MPVARLEGGAFLHVGRLPLGCGWSGTCAAPGHEGEVPSQDELQHLCNLGYSHGCGRLPKERDWDAVRFSARPLSGESDGNGGRIQVRYVCERGHLPAEHGMLVFDVVESRWTQRHCDVRVQRMAECFLEVYVEKRKSREVLAVAG
jgi:hypothetical protein